jgi:glycosyltransferase involved in cell wall biosynthesis
MLAPVSHPATRPGKRRIAIVASHVVQYHAPWFRRLDQLCELQVFFAHDQSASDHARAYGVAFQWDTELKSGYRSTYLRNIAKEPNVGRFHGCDTPEIGERLRAGGYDAVVVSGWNLKAYWQAVVACRRQGVPVLVRGDSQMATPRAAAKRVAKQLVYPLMLRQFDGFLSVGTRNTEYLRHYGIASERISFVPHFVDRALFAAAANESVASRARLREQLGLDSDSTLALFVGRQVESKRPLDLIEALGVLRQQGVHYHAVFAGAGPLEAEIRARATQLGVGVSLLGFRNQSELPALYASCDMLVLPSDGRETWGLVVNEAMSCGIPAVVSQDVGCAPDLIVPGRTGALHACGDVAGLARGLCAARGLVGTSALAAALSEKMGLYSCEEAAQNTVQAVELALARKREAHGRQRAS